MHREQITPVYRKIKRKRGGQLGNRNARKHGFYSNSLDVSELCGFWNSVNLNSVEPEIAVLNIKLRSLLRVAPDNRRVLGEAVKLLVKWYSVKYGLDKTDSLYLKKVINGVVENASLQLPEDIVREH